MRRILWRSRIDRIAAAGLVVFLAAACTPPAESTGPPNLLLITLDTTRVDALGLYGNRGGHSPNIDRLAANAVVFERAIAPIGQTIPSHATLFTGLLPSRHGVRSNADTLEQEHMFLAARLQQHGYDTAAFVSFRSMLTRAGLNRGFASLSDEPLASRQPRTRDGDEVNRLAQTWLAKPRSKPFFLWLHYFEAHAPYRLTRYAERQLADYQGPLRDGAPVWQFNLLGTESPWSDSERRAIRVLYDGEVREADRLVGAILDRLDETGLVENTVVILTADHGQLLGIQDEGDRVGHSSTVADAVLRVPLVVRDPRHPGPLRVSTRVGLVDLAPTVLELAGAALDEAQIAQLDGRSIAAAVRGETLAERPYHAEVQNQVQGSWEFDPTLVAAYASDLKLVIGHDGMWLYDLESDQRALTPLDRPWPESSLELTRAARRHRDGLAPTAPTEIEPDVEKELRELGYTP
jgi:arylsulfatase